MGYIKSCELCERAVEQMPPLKGKNFGRSKLMCILHKPDNRVNSILWSKHKYEMALWTSKTGVQIAKLLEYCGLTAEDVLLTNLFKCTLRDDAKPRKGEYINCLRNLELQVKALEPRKIVAFGSPVYRTLFPGNGKITDAIGEQLMYMEVPTLVMNHPSRIWALRNPEKIKREYDRVKAFFETQ